MTNQQQSYTIWSPQDTVKDVAESLGLDNINEDVLKALAMDVEYRILEIVEQAVKFKRHSKTEVLTTGDVAKALKVLNVEPLYGYHDNLSFDKNVSYTKVHTSGGQSVYYLNEEEVDFDKLINEPLPQVPRLPNFSTHWLAIEGVQPAIVENPNLLEIRSSIPPTTRGAIVTALNDNSLQTASGSSSSALTLQEDKISQPLSSVKPGQNTEVKPLVKHVLSKELQIYFNKVISALTSKDQEDVNAQHMRTAALTSLRTDNGLHQLVPYFIQFIAEQITHNLSDLELLTTILEMIYSLLSNPSIFLDPYIHSLMPSILTLLLAKKLGGAPNTDSKDDLTEFLEKTNALRDFAASLLDYVLKKFPQVYKSLKPRVTRTLLKTFLDTNRVFGTYYGCLKGITVLESEAVRFFLGNLYNWARLIFNEQNNTLEEFEKANNVSSTPEHGQQDANEKGAEERKTDESSEGKELEKKAQNLSVFTKFTADEVKYLVETVIGALCVLKKDLPEIYEGKDADVTSEDKEKLVKRVGVTISSAIVKREDAKELICAIFFGEE
ncbi:hypothetical protein KAFR_0A04500 [Kazachstania africana CBS 2517]|uniref:TBP-associated factor 6 n=1 Tax=Kazachstania africana (strain ATCC 22294 / BCRC 22015 / CBS 2517 / CECT 1963 / NBRC 1671 / NRRL Y-8276) TaxID=1071382 RepID=H2AND5_KAZAF|nr:hypothetical protein KAFR_0A04500 [Kazachstania africana CBS 2517]CCF55885.1 hypothetical protein KAFR_0A04500 [Kazachstania africana CBS 2517]